MKKGLVIVIMLLTVIIGMYNTNVPACADNVKNVNVAKKSSDIKDYPYQYSGWKSVSGEKFYYKNGVKLTHSAIIDGIRYKFASNGICQGKYTGWTKSSLGRRYWKNGKVVENKWIKAINGNYYYAGNGGYLLVGWAEVTRIGGKYSYFDSNGVWDGKIYWNKANDEITKYADKNNDKEYIILNITPDVVYWNDIYEFDTESFDIAVPAIFTDWLGDADEIMIYLNFNCGTFGFITLDNDITIRGMTYPHYWSTDYLCPIKNGIVRFGDITEDISKYFIRVDDGVYIEEANYYYKENPFENNMSVERLDTYFMTIKKDYNSMMERIAEDPYTDYEIAGFWGYQDGIRLRASINKIY